jgi:putative membrane protein
MIVNPVFFIVGIFLGILSGLIPGLHSNTIISILSSLGLSKEDLAMLILVVFPFHLVISFIPSIFFGIPEQGTVVAVLPGQRMVLEGKGLTALKVVLLSSLLAALISVVLFYPSLSLFPFIYPLIKPYIGYILLSFSLILLLRSRNPFLSAFLFLAAGFLGVYALRAEITDNFLPLFSGMFTMGTILNYKKSKIPTQKEEPLEINFIKFTILGVIAGFVADLLPAISSPSQIATFLTIFVPLNTLGYLAAISSISMSEAIFSFATTASIEKSRIGATAMLAKQLQISENLLFVLAIFLFSVALGVGIVYLLRKHIGKLALLDFSKFNILLAVYLVAIIFVLDGFTGLVIFSMASLLGFVAVRLEIERTMLMGAVIVPTMLLLFKIFIF